MPPKVAILLANGFEEAEAIIIYDILVRLKINAVMLSTNQELLVNSYHNLQIIAHSLLSQKKDETYDAIVLPGGPDGSDNLAKNPEVIKFIERHDNKKAWICPICSASVKVLGTNQLLKGRKYTCSGDLYDTIVNDGVYQDNDVVIDGNLLTGRGLGIAFKFAFVLAEKLNIDPKKVSFQAEHIYLHDKE